MWDEGSWVGALEGYTGTPTQPSQDPVLDIFLRLSPTYGQMKAILRLNEVSQDRV